MWKLKDYDNTGTFGIIDNFTCRYVETLDRNEAIEKYGECEVWSSYTAGFSNIPNANGKAPSFKTDVWVKIPGMTIGYSNSDNLHLLFCGDNKEATFTGKISGKQITIRSIDKYTNNYKLEYDIIWHDSNGDRCERCDAKETIAKIKKEWEGERS